MPKNPDRVEKLPKEKGIICAVFFLLKMDKKEKSCYNIIGSI